MPPKYPVSDPQFWKERLEVAKKNGHLHYSVYLVNPIKWKLIYDAHRAILEKEITTTGLVLDAGCGYGRMAHLFTPKQYVGIDISPDLIKIAKETEPNYQFEVGDLTNLEHCGNKVFDFAFCISIKQMVVGNLSIGDWVLIQAELMRVAKKVIILEYEEPEIYTMV